MKLWVFVNDKVGSWYPNGAAYPKLIPLTKFSNPMVKLGVLMTKLRCQSHDIREFSVVSRCRKSLNSRTNHDNVYKHCTYAVLDHTIVRRSMIL